MRARAWHRLKIGCRCFNLDAPALWLQPSHCHAERCSASHATLPLSHWPQVQVLRCIKPPSLDNVVLGQYTAADGEDGYLDDPTVPQGSRTPTFASIVLYIDNDRWAGVPFIIKAGKALDERKAEIRIQLHETPHFIFAGESSSSRNELVVRLQPDEAIYMKFIVKKPGLRRGRAQPGGVGWHETLCVEGKQERRGFMAPRVSTGKLLGTVEG